MPGFAYMRFASFKPFWPLALAQQAPQAIILQRGAFSRTVSVFKVGRSLWPSGLTVQSSRPAYGGRLTFGVSIFTLKFATEE